jgi:hypothetical protein
VAAEKDDAVDGAAAGWRWCDHGGQSRRGDRSFEIGKLAVRLSAIRLSRRHGATAVRDVAIEQLRKVGALVSLVAASATPAVNLSTMS